MNAQIRQDFPVTQRFIHLDGATISPMPTPVAKAAQGYLDGRNDPPSIRPWLAKSDEVRQQVADLIGAQFDEIAFGMCTGDGLNLMASAIDWRAGDNAVMDDLSYVTDFVLWHAYEQRYGIELRIVQNQAGSAPVEAFAPLVDDRTRVISISYVSHQNGYLHDVRGLADLAHAHGAYLYADGIQAIGAIPVDVRAVDVDVLACGTYKWVFGPFGLAFLYVKTELQDRISPNRYGFMQIERTAHQRFPSLERHGEFQDFRDWSLFRTAKQYEYGTYHFGGLYELGAGLRYIEEIGLERLSNHIVGLAFQLQRGLADLGYELYTPPGNPTSIVTCFLDDAERVGAALKEAGIAVTLRESQGQMRVSTSVFNLPGEIETFLDCMKRLR